MKPNEYQRLDIDPKVGGKSLLHTNNGIPKVTPYKQQKKRNIQFTNEPVMIKAQSNQPEDDGFVPPRSNFAAVGSTANPAWYDAVQVPEPEKSPQVQEEEDENEFYPVDKFKFTNPLADIEDSVLSKEREELKDHLAIIKKFVIDALGRVETLQELEQFKNNYLSNNGLIFRAYTKLKDNSKKEHLPILGELFNSVYSDLTLETQGKEFELAGEDSKEESQDDVLNELMEPVLQDDGPSAFEKDEMVKDNNPSVDFPELSEGQYAIIINNEQFVTADNKQEALDIISKLVLQKNVEFEQIQLLKRLSINFGVTIGE